MMRSFAAPPAALARSPLASSQSFRAKQLCSRFAQQQQIEEIVATALITERPNGACRNEHNKGL
jgi:hypothetical protein